jgi:hypothetical protein
MFDDCVKNFIVFVEQNLKEKESYVFYLQYSQNEYDIYTFANYINKVSYDDKINSLVDSRFFIDFTHLLWEETVDEQMEVKIKGEKYFTKCEGKFNMDFTEFDKLSEEELAVLFDDMFYGGKISNYFS